MRHPVVLDLESKNTFRQYSDPAKLGVTVVGLYNYADESFSSYFENELSQLFRLLEKASLIVGYNISGFDLPVLQAYYVGKLADLPSFDLCDDVRDRLGRRLGLADLTKATLNRSKSGHGLEAIELYKEGRLEELKNYCLDDVALTKDLFDFGLKHGQIFYPDVTGVRPLAVDWKKPLDEPNATPVSLGLPF